MAVKRTPQIVFMTGANGFIGRAVLDRLSISNIHKVVCLVRRPRERGSSPPARGTVEYVHGDICEPQTYADTLSGIDTVLHLAAATGAASETRLWTVNVAGTRGLLEACTRKGVQRFVFVSSIAAATSCPADYPYARTKLEAENVVKNSGLPYIILRPTIVLGECGGNWRLLRKLACMPVIPAFGGSTARVQPVDLADIVRGIELILKDGEPENSLIELGGPEVLTFADLIRRIRRACGRGGSIMMPVPMRPTKALLRLARYLFGESFPISAGQLEPFVRDGIATPNSLYNRLRSEMVPLDELFARLANAECRRARDA